MNIKSGRWAVMPGERQEVAQIHTVSKKGILWKLGSDQGATAIDKVAATFSTMDEAESAFERYRQSRKFSAPVIHAAADRLSEAQRDFDLVKKNAHEIAMRSVAGEQK